MLYWKKRLQGVPRRAFSGGDHLQSRVNREDCVGKVEENSTGTSRQSPLGLVKIIPVSFRMVTNSCYNHTSHRGQTKEFSAVGPRSGH